MATPVASFNRLVAVDVGDALDDLNAAPEVYDPRSRGTRYPGRRATRSRSTPRRTSRRARRSVAPTHDRDLALAEEVFEDNVYYWRVRALDPDGNAGVWNAGGSFMKTFDKVAPPGMTAPSIKNLHMRDNLTDPGSTGLADYRLPDPGAGRALGRGPRRGELRGQVAPYTGVTCDWTAPATTGT